MDPAGSETTHVNTIFTRELEISPLTICQCRRWPAPEGEEPKPVMYERRGGSLIAANLANNPQGAGQWSEEGQGEANTTHAPDAEPGKYVRKLSHVRRLQSSGRKNGLPHCSTS